MDDKTGLVSESVASHELNWFPPVHYRNDSLVHSRCWQVVESRSGRQSAGNDGDAGRWSLWPATRQEQKREYERALNDACGAADEYTHGRIASGVL